MTTGPRPRAEACGNPASRRQYPSSLEGGLRKGREGLRTRAFSYLEKELEGREYLCGTFTLADAPYMALAMVLDVDRMPLDVFPRVAAYLERLRARPSYRSISPQTSLADSAGRE